MKNQEDLNNYAAQLLPYAYNILGTMEDARDSVQDVIFKYLKENRTGIENQSSYLIRSVINHSINLKQRMIKFQRSDSWLPEPYSTDLADNDIKTKEVLSYSMLVLLERLSAKERGVFILKEAFGYTHEDISQALGMSIENSRKLLSRSRKKLQHQELTSTSGFRKYKEQLNSFIQAITTGELEELENLLSTDIQLMADGGDSANVIKSKCFGRTSTARLLLDVYRTYLSDCHVVFRELNHQPAILFVLEGEIRSCQVLQIEAGHIVNIYSVVDSRKLSSISLP